MHGFSVSSGASFAHLKCEAVREHLSERHFVPGITVNRQFLINRFKLSWIPRCAERDVPVFFHKRFIQLNSRAEQKKIHLEVYVLFHQQYGFFSRNELIFDNATHEMWRVIE